MKKSVKQYRPYDSCISVTEEMLISDIVNISVKHPCMHHICVVDDENRLKGIINRKRIFQSVFLHHLTPNLLVSKLYTLINAKRAKDLMISQFYAVKENEEIDSVIEKMILNDLYEIPVLDDEEHLKGTLSWTTILKGYIDDR